MTLKLNYEEVYNDLLNIDDSKLIDDTILMDQNRSISQLFDYLFFPHSFNYTSTTGTRTSETYDISTVNKAKGSLIYWKSNVPTSTSLLIETNVSFDGGVTWNGWQTATNYSPIIGIPSGSTTDVSNARLQIRQTLSTSDTTVSPELYDIDFTIEDVNSNNVKDIWDLDTILNADFLNSDLEGGNITNDGVSITQFAIKRRKLSDLTPLTLGYVDFVNDSTIEYTDLTQANDEYIYSIVPIGNNGLEGNPIEATIESDFVGIWLIDKDTGNTIPFNIAIGGMNSFSTQYNQGRQLIETLNKYPSIYYTGTAYHSFTLQATFLPDDWARTGFRYQDILSKFVDNHIPCLVKTDTGNLFVVDLYNPKVDAPQNTWNGYDYFTMSLDCTEIMDYESYMNDVSG